MSKERLLEVLEEVRADLHEVEHRAAAVSGRLILARGEDLLRVLQSTERLIVAAGAYLSKNDLREAGHDLREAHWNIRGLIFLLNISGDDVLQFPPNK